MRRTLLPSLLCVGLVAVLAGCGSTLHRQSLTSIDTRTDMHQALRDASRTVLVSFYSKNCPWCWGVKPVLEQCADDYAGRVDFYRIDGEAHPEIRDAYRVTGYPTVLLFVGGFEQQRFAGPKGELVYRAAIDEALAAAGASEKDLAMTAWLRRSLTAMSASDPPPDSCPGGRCAAGPAVAVRRSADPVH